MAKYHGYGTVIYEYKTLKPTKQMCHGCYCDDYNYGLGGARECWSFKNAKVVDVEAYYDLNSCKKTKYKKSLSCYHGVNK